MQYPQIPTQITIIKSYYHGQRYHQETRRCVPRNPRAPTPLHQERTRQWRLRYPFQLGFVFEAFDEVRQQRVALKRVQKVGSEVSREYEILKEVNDSQFVVKILDFYYSRTNDDRLI